MGIKLFMISFMLTSIIFSFLYILPNKLTLPVTNLNPMITLNTLPKSPNTPYNVTFAYLISASKGETQKLKRLLRALYHPGNHYLIHIDSEAPEVEQRDIAEFVYGDPVFGLMGNVLIVGKPNLVTYRGPTMLATTLHAISMLLRCCNWDWFINLSASDYPLLTQDDLNFIQHSSRLGWKLNKRGKPIIIDPGLYSKNKSDIWWVIKERSLPTAFKLYTGSAWTMLSRSFSEYCIVGWDNLPRTLLLYYTNFVSSPEGYFQTVICNSKEYRNTTVNHDLHYITWDIPPKQHPRSLGLKDFRKMVISNRPFARKFKQNDSVLNRIDHDLLKRQHEQFNYGGWCSGNGNWRRACTGLNNENYGVLKPGPGSRRLKTLLTRLLSERNFSRRQCR
ncbi:beta-glucuronosyltransferase GlcAT14A isoform X2 [Carica papaya]|uniref:beta-glucuronosyltransferase GlcAT14A isoform X2 n=1 Tax=Carica papaya TaxID=3649 RepID=UPI000B8CEEFD|nr:beta-glucuronosyltransferase GlcAT14A isoform X2 [Carica papaya]